MLRLFFYSIVLLTLNYCKGLAQVANFRQFQEPYQYLKNDVVPFENYKWDELFSFDINFQNAIGFDSILGTNLLIQGDGSASIATPFDPEDGALIIIPFGYYYIDKSIKLNLPKPVSPISYLFEEINGETVLKVQWKNVGFQLGGPNDSANFQFWLFSKSQKVQFRYGESYVANIDSMLAIDTMQIGVSIYTNVTDKGTYLVGTPSNISLSTDGFATFHGIPASGTVYEFTSLSLGIDRKRNKQINFKIENDQLIVHTDASNFVKLELMDLLGNKVASTSSGIMAINNLNSGIYILDLQLQNQSIRQKIFLSR